MYRVCTSDVTTKRSPANAGSAGSAYGPVEPRGLRKRNGALPTLEDIYKKPIRSGLSVVTQAIRRPQSALHELCGTRGHSLTLSYGLFNPHHVEEACIAEASLAQKNWSPEHWHYDARSMNHRRRALRFAIKHDEIKDALCLFRTTLTRNIGGVGNPDVHAPDVGDAKDPFFRYKTAVKGTADRLHDLFKEVKAREERLYLFDCICETVAEYGKSATLLSGGGTLGMYHIGVLKILREADPKLISPVVSGTSAGSIVASVFASKKDEDLDEAIHKLCHGDLDVFLGRDEGVAHIIRGIWERRTIYDPANLERVMKNLLGEKLTFRDAYNLTGKSLNIAVSTVGAGDDYRLLNHRTSPDILVWSAVVASCAVPFAFPAGKLYSRDSSDEIIAVDSPVGHTDGSLHADVPTERMSRYFNVNYFVVSQVNPHVVFFLNTDKTAPRNCVYSTYSAGMSTLRSAILGCTDTFFQKGFSNNILHASDSLLRQSYEGDVTLFPTAREPLWWNITKSLRNPDHAFMDNAVIEGEKEAQKMLSKVHAVLDVEMMLRDLRQKLGMQLQFSKSQEDLNREEIQRRTSRGRACISLSRLRKPEHHRTKSATYDDQVRTVNSTYRSSALHELEYKQHNNSAEKVAGSEYDSQDCSTVFDSNDDDDDEYSDEENSVEMRSKIPLGEATMFQSHPASPVESRRRSYFPPSRSTSASSSRSSSPGAFVGSMNLMMTPATPSCPTSPEQSRRQQRGKPKKQRGGSDSTGSPSLKTRISKSLRTLVDFQSGITTTSHRLGRDFLRKRSLSASGVTEWTRSSDDERREQVP